MDRTTGGRCQGVIFDTTPHVKGNIHKIGQPAMLYGMETVSMTSTHMDETGSERDEDV